jgi:hypothetical protein
MLNSPALDGGEYAAEGRFASMGGCATVIFRVLVDTVVVRTVERVLDVIFKRFSGSRGR